MNENLPFIVIGHRGCAGVEPENTLRGIGCALEMGCVMVEIDVHLVEGRLMVIHDVSVDRTTNGSGKLEDLSFEYVRSLDAGMGEKVPELVEVLDLCRDHAVVNIELKGQGVVEDVLKLLEGREDEVILSSFDWDMLREVRDRDPSVPLAVLVDDGGKVDAAFVLADELAAISLNPSMKVLTKELVEQAHAAQLLVCPFTVRSKDDLQKVRGAGADGCFADDPSMV